MLVPRLARRCEWVCAWIQIDTESVWEISGPRPLLRRATGGQTAHLESQRWNHSVRSPAGCPNHGGGGRITTPPASWWVVANPEADGLKSNIESSLSTGSPAHLGGIRAYTFMFEVPAPRRYRSVSESNTTILFSRQTLRCTSW